MENPNPEPYPDGRFLVCEEPEARTLLSCFSSLYVATEAEKKTQGCSFATRLLPYVVWYGRGETGVSHLKFCC